MKSFFYMDKHYLGDYKITIQVSTDLLFRWWQNYYSGGYRNTVQMGIELLFKWLQIYNPAEYKITIQVITELLFARVQNYYSGEYRITIYVTTELLFRWMQNHCLPSQFNDTWINFQHDLHFDLDQDYTDFMGFETPGGWYSPADYRITIQMTSDFQVNTELLLQWLRIIIGVTTKLLFPIAQNYYSGEYRMIIQATTGLLFRGV